MSDGNGDGIAGESGDRSDIKSEIKTESSETQGDDIKEDEFVVLEEDDGEDDNEDDEMGNNPEIEEMEKLADENDKLRQVIIRMGERQAVLEEFMEVEYGAKFDKFLTNRERLINIVGIGDNAEMFDGKRSSKSAELASLLKLVRDQAHPNGGAGGGGISSGSPRTGSGHSQDSKGHGGGSSHSPNKPGSSSGVSPAASSSHTQNRKIEFNKKSYGNIRDLKKDTCNSCFLSGHDYFHCPNRDTTSSAVKQGITERRKQFYNICHKLDLNTKSSKNQGHPAGRGRGNMTMGRDRGAHVGRMQ